MRRVALTVQSDDMEDAFDAVLLAAPDGAFERRAGDDRVELSWAVRNGDDGGSEAVRLALGERVLAWREEEVDDAAWAAQSARSYSFGGRLVVRPADAPPPPGGSLDVVLVAGVGGFGSGDHPTTRGCLELLLGVPPEGDLADLGCGSGVIAIAAAKLGFAPVFAVDHEPTSVHATAVNGQTNRVVLQLAEADLLEVPPPPARTIVANVPLAVHRHMAANLGAATRTVIVSGLGPGHAEPARAAYEAAGLEFVRDRPVREWTTLQMEREAR